MNSGPGKRQCAKNRLISAKSLKNDARGRRLARFAKAPIDPDLLYHFPPFHFTLIISDKHYAFTLDMRFSQLSLEKIWGLKLLLERAPCSKNIGWWEAFPFRSYLRSAFK